MQTHTERDLAAPTERVWELVSDPEKLGDWLGAEVDVELEPGSEGTIVFDDTEEEAVVLIEEVDEGRRLVFRWATSADEPSEVAIELSPIEIGTRIVIRERVLPNGTASPIATMSTQLRSTQLRSTQSRAMAAV